MIIGITGYAGSGKDTFAQAIQYVTSTYPVPEHLTELTDIFRISGKLGSKWQIRKFADGVRDVARVLAPGVRFDSWEEKLKNMPPEWSTNGVPMTVREFLQKVGTDAMRDGLHPDVWVNYLMSKYFANGFTLEQPMVYPSWLITDVRFPNEVAAVRNKGGIIVRVDRSGVAPVNSHVSESYIAQIEADCVVNNSFTFRELIEEANKVLAYVKERTARHGGRP